MSPTIAVYVHVAPAVNYINSLPVGEALTFCSVGLAASIFAVWFFHRWEAAMLLTIGFACSTLFFVLQIAITLVRGLFVSIPWASFTMESPLVKVACMLGVAAYLTWSARFMLSRPH